MAKPKKLPTGMQDRGSAYYSNFRSNGRLVRKRLSADFKTACSLLLELRNRADRSGFGVIDNDYPWDRLRAEFRLWAKQTRKDSSDYESDLNKIEQYQKPASIREIDEQFAIGFRKWRLDHGVSARTVNKQIGTLSNMLNKAVGWRRIAENPLEGLKKLPHDNLRKERRALSVEEVEAIFSGSPDYLRPVWRMLATTGIRKKELVTMQFAAIDHDRKLVTIPRGVAKNHKAREIPLDDAMLAMINELEVAAANRQPVKGNTPANTARQRKNLSRSHVFVSRANTPLRNNLLTRFYAICKRAGIEGAESGGSVDIHALRGTFATLSIEGGATPKALQTILGHSTLGMTMGRYTKASDRAKRAVIDALPFASTTSPEHILSIAEDSPGSERRRATG